MTVYCYITFPTTYYALRAEALVKHSSVKFKMVPVPRSISSSCGIALRCPCQDRPQVERFLKENRIETDGAYEIAEKEFTLPSILSKKAGPTHEK